MHDLMRDPSVYQVVKSPTATSSDHADSCEHVDHDPSSTMLPSAERRMRREPSTVSSAIVLRSRSTRSYRSRR